MVMKLKNCWRNIVLAAIDLNKQYVLVSPIAKIKSHRTIGRIQTYKAMLRFDKKYFLFAIILFVSEVLIAVFVRDAFVRPYVGDFLVVILIYCAVRSVLNARVINVAIGTLLFAYAIEVLQYFQIVDRLGLQNNVVAKTVIGYGFEWLDLVAYTLGVCAVLALERNPFNNPKKNNTEKSLP